MTFPLDDDFDGEDDTYLDCALGPDGQCAMAGTEDCDFECPNSHGELYAGSEAWHRKHSAGAPVDGCECDECRTARAKVR